MSLITLLFKMVVFCGFCVSFHASSYCMLTETTTALLFKLLEIRKEEFNF